MGHLAFVLLIVSSSFCYAVEEAIEQEVQDSMVQGESLAALDDEKREDAALAERSSEKGQENNSNSKSKGSLAEEFFASPLNYILVLIVCFYVFLMFVQPRNAKREKKLHFDRISNLKKNDRVVTTSGIHGIVSNINSDAGTVTLRVDENSNAKLTIDRDSIRSVAS